MHFLSLGNEQRSRILGGVSQARRFLQRDSRIGNGDLSEMLSKGAGKARAETYVAETARRVIMELRFFMMVDLKMWRLKQ